jgi:hypothetical protein
MSDTFTAVLCIVAVFLGLPVLMLWLRDRISYARRRRRNPPGKRAADRRAYEDRILRPDWEFYEGHLRRPAPPALRELFGDPALVTALDLHYTDADDINTFEPLDEQALLDTKAWLGIDALPIAASGLGDPIYLRPGAAEPDTVYITRHDGGDTAVFAESVAAMLEELRRANRAA